jgi:hypothetical protein
MNCGAKVPAIHPLPKKDKTKKKRKRSKAKVVIPVFTVLILAALSFLIFGGDMVPEKVRSLKSYSYLTGMAREKLPDQISLPFELEFPFDFSFELPFKLPDPGSLLADIASSGEKKGGEESGGDGDENEESKEDKAFDKEARDAIAAGVDDSVIISDRSLYADISSDWKRIKVEVLEHNPDAGAGTDTVIVYLEMENSYVNMAGTREVIYSYNSQTEKWEATPASKIVCLSMEPADADQQAVRL